MDKSLKPNINPDYSIEKFDDEILLYSETGAQAVYLNDTAHVVWLLCKEELTVEDIIHYLEEVYPEQRDQIEVDVITALNTLHSSGVIYYLDEK